MKENKSAMSQVSDSEQSQDTSVSLESQDGPKTINSSKTSSKKGEWEILEALKEGQKFEFLPSDIEGFLLKRRKWPLKGWHKRYFVLNQSVLTYAKTPADIQRGKTHGCLDIGMSVVSTQVNRLRIDIDEDTYICHLKCPSKESYSMWVEKLKQHRLYKQHQLQYCKNVPKLSSPQTSDESPSASVGSSLPGTLSKDTKSAVSTLTGAVAGAGTLRSWLVDSSFVDSLSKDLASAHQHLHLLTQCYGTLEHIEEGETTPSAVKTRKKFRLRKTKPNKLDDKKSTHSESIMPAQIDSNLSELQPLSTSNPSLPVYIPYSLHSAPLQRPHSCTDEPSNQSASNIPTASSYGSSLSPPVVTVDKRYRSKHSISYGGPSSREDFLVLSKEIINHVSGMLRSIQLERDHLKQALDSESSVLASHSAATIISYLRNSLNESVQQNAELRGRLARIHADSDLADFAPIVSSEVHNRSLRNSMSYESSSCFSASEYYDANEGIGSDSSSEVSSDNSSFTSETSDNAYDVLLSEAIDSESTYNDGNKCSTGRRTRLPVVKSLTQDFSLLSFLYKNIGKDLSKVSMPVSLNEPLSMLQRLCEELEYSELLDKASGLSNADQRMIYVASFAVSAYASSIYRAAHKPFNPILGETFECIREDKGFRFIAEQVGHHPTISACYAESSNFIFWQDSRIKTKFWGKSLEIQPSGVVHLYFPAHDEHYEWNKITTCVHNLYGGGNRWVDQYGEMLIVNKKEGITCQLNFVKANSWSSKCHEVFGTICDSEDQVLHNLFGKWTEVLYCGDAPSAHVVWRPGTMPEDYQLYYGFTRFAIELNEIDPEQSTLIPPTDSRFRPDQRHLEEGDVAGAAMLKQRLEQQQRERRKKIEKEGLSHAPKWFRHEIKGSEDAWIFNNEYWSKRKDPGFVNMLFEPLW